jgi:CRP/FNR family cyclic AMP-dependent transcriptional regulator
MARASTALSVEKLQHNPFFEEFAETEIQQLLKVSELHTFKPGDYVLREGDASHHICIIVSGRISIGKTLYAGDEKELGVLEEGEFFGEMGFLDESPRSASASCLDKAAVLIIDRNSFDQLANRRPTIAFKLMRKIARTLSNRLRISNDLVEGIFSNPNKAIVELKTRLLKIQTMLLKS